MIYLPPFIIISFAYAQDDKLLVSKFSAEELTVKTCDV